MSNDPEQRKLSLRAQDWLNERGISPELWRDRYIEFEGAAQTRSYYPLGELLDNQLADLSKMVNWMAGVNSKGKRVTSTGEPINPDPGGIIIRRIPPPDESPIGPEIKPWTPMKGRKTIHYHGDLARDLRTDEEKLALIERENLRNPENGKLLTPGQVESPKRAEKHIAGQKHDEDAEIFPDVSTWHRNRQDVHIHLPPQKYRFLAEAVEHTWREHTHQPMNARDDEMLANHLRKRHAGEPAPMVDEPHEHRYPNKQKTHLADRIDIHPLALPLFEKAKTVYFGIEGCPKADSMLSEILETEEAAAVCSVPGVTMWSVPELQRFATKYLKGKHVVVVCDSDWAEPDKPEVFFQAMVFRTFLQDILHLDAHVAAPPNLKHPDPKKRKQGFDDFRGKHGGKIEKMIVIDKETGPGFKAWAENDDLDRMDRRGIVRMMRALVLHSNDEGETLKAVTAYARILGVTDRTVRTYLKDLEARGLIRVKEGTEGTLDVREGRYLWSGYYPGPEWINPPTIVIREDLRGEPLSKVPLRKARQNWRVRDPQKAELFVEFVERKGFPQPALDLAESGLAGVKAGSITNPHQLSKHLNLPNVATSVWREAWSLCEKVFKH